MLLNEKQIALNELIVAYREAADHFTDAIEYLDNKDLKKLFENIQSGHSQAAERLSEEVRETGTLPRAQHADREQFHQIVTHVKAALSEDDRQVFLRDRIEHEHQIVDLIAETLKLNIPTATHAFLEGLLSTEVDILSRLHGALDDCST